MVARGTLAGVVCNALRVAGIGRVNPGHPRLTALLEAGAGVDAFIGAAGSLKPGISDQFAYVLATVEGQMAEAQHVVANGKAKAANGNGLNGHSGSPTRAARMAEAVPGLAKKNGLHPPEDFIEGEVHDVTPRRLG